MIHAEQYYRSPNGAASKELLHYTLALKPLCRLYGSEAVADFTPRKLKAVRATWIAKDTSRKHTNAQTGRLKRVLRWGVAEGLVPVMVHQAAQALEGLRRGRCDAKDGKPVRPAPVEHVEAVKPRVSRQVVAMIELQLLTACRPGEICGARPIDIDMRGAKVWVLRPATQGRMVWTRA